MPHFYVKPENIKNKSFIMDNELVHYVSNVRRFQEGDEIMIFDGKGNSYAAVISSVSKKLIEGKILSSSYSLPEKKIILYTAIPKGGRFEWLIEKAGELGIAELVPVNTKRSVTMSFSQNKLERYEKISIAASSQCGRSDIMKIRKPADFKTACKNAAENRDLIGVLPWESENLNVISDIFNEKSYGGASIFIGPEGGFENEEIEFALKTGIKTITLGKNILRVETAAIAASILVLNAFGVYSGK